MKVLLNDQGYVESYALEGELLNSIETVAPQDVEHFENRFTSYRIRDGTLVFDDSRAAAEQTEAAKEAYRRLRQIECFPIINRGRLWYDTLSDEQLSELNNWYRAWLDGTDTQSIPDKPAWLN